MNVRMIAMLLGFMLGCSGCAALPAEEKAFAVALCIEHTEEAWRVYSRIPAYQTGGGYRTVAGQGATLPLALADMERNAPMRLHLSQLRLLVFGAGMGETEELRKAMRMLAERPDMSLQCAVAVSEDDMQKIADALKPAAGARLSKALDVLLKNHREQGLVLPAALGDVLRMGERQSPILMGLTLEQEEIRISGGWPMTLAGRLAAPVTEQETALLSLLQETARNPVLMVSGRSENVRQYSSRVSLAADWQHAELTLTLRIPDEAESAKRLERELADACLQLLSRLTEEGCDVLGLGRKAMVRMRDMEQWRALDWPTILGALEWRIAVGVQGRT